MADISKQDLVAAFNMPPEAAVAFLASKGLVVTESWRELWKAAHARAFTVARSAGYDVVADIKDALLYSLNNGTSYKDFAKNLTPILQSKGWWGKAIDKNTGEIKTYEGTDTPVQLGSPRRLRLIYEQNLQTAFMAGRQREMLKATGSHPYWQYVAVMDARTRPSHGVMNGRVFSYDDDVWSVAYPPNGWRCRCRVRPISKFRFADEGMKLETAKGYISDIQIKRKDGGFDTLKTINLPNMPKTFKPDVGWDYNPAGDYYKQAA